MKIGLFGGTFDPIHNGHLILAQECWYQLELDKVIFIPAFISPHKTSVQPTGASDRLNMVRAALDGDSRFEISTYELDKTGVSYTIDTIKHFIDLYGADHEYFFIAGADTLIDLSTWKDTENIVKHVMFASVPRPGYDMSGISGDRIIKLDMPEIDISSSAIRKRIKGRKPIDFWVPTRVVKYIRNKGLYRL